MMTDLDYREIIFDLKRKLQRAEEDAEFFKNALTRGNEKIILLTDKLVRLEAQKLSNPQVVRIEKVEEVLDELFEGFETAVKRMKYKINS